MNILPGEWWKPCIRKNIRQADLCLIILSKNSVSKSGIFQKEIRLALNTAYEKLDNEIFIIPLRLEECEVPEKLNKIQWINYFEKDGQEKLMKAIETKMVQKQ